jgi:hypothetical protein
MMMSIEEFKSQIVYGLSNYVPHGQLEIDEMNPVRFKARYHVVTRCKKTDVKRGRDMRDI